jgi:hypothetical protein
MYDDWFGEGVVAVPPHTYGPRLDGKYLYCTPLATYDAPEEGIR